MFQSISPADGVGVSKQGDCSSTGGKSSGVQKHGVGVSEKEDPLVARAAVHKLLTRQVMLVSVLSRMRKVMFSPFLMQT